MLAAWEQARVISYMLGCHVFVGSVFKVFVQKSEWDTHNKPCDVSGEIMNGSVRPELRVCSLALAST